MPVPRGPSHHLLHRSPGFASATSHSNLLWSTISLAGTASATTPLDDAAIEIPDDARTHSGATPSDDSDASTQCGDHGDRDTGASLVSHVSPQLPDDQSVGSMLDSITSQETGIVSLEHTSDNGPSFSNTTMSDDGVQECTDPHEHSGQSGSERAGTVLDPHDANSGSGHGGNAPWAHVATIHDWHDADSGSGRGGGSYSPQPAPPDYNDTHFPHPDDAYRRSGANLAAVALAAPSGRLCSTSNCKRFSRFSFTGIEWPVCCTLCYSQGCSSYSRTCDASQGTRSTHGCHRRLSSDPLVGWHPVGEHFCCVDCITTAGA